QGAEGDAGVAPLPVPGVREGGELGAGVPGGVRVPGVVPGPAAGAARPGGGAEALVAVAAQPRVEAGRGPGGRGARLGAAVPAGGDAGRAAQAAQVPARGTAARIPPGRMRTGRDA